MSVSSAVIVHCHVPGGLVLQLTEVVVDEFGYRVSRRTGSVVPLVYGDNHGVDQEFMGRWTDQYAKSALASYVTVRPAEDA